VLVWKLDRFGRSAFDLLGNIRQLQAAGVRFVSVTQGIRPGGDPMSRLAFHSGRWHRFGYA
jgi:DNA invertase Pin-like site-specific DNA recombinase